MLQPTHASSQPAVKEMGLEVHEADLYCASSCVMACNTAAEKRL